MDTRTTRLERVRASVHNRLHRLDQIIAVAPIRQLVDIGHDIDYWLMMAAGDRYDDQDAEHSEGTRSGDEDAARRATG